MSTGSSNSWLRQQRKSDLVEVADSVGLQKYVQHVAARAHRILPIATRRISNPPFHHFLMWPPY